MSHERTTKFWYSAAQFFVGGVALALLTFTCFRLNVNSTTVALLYLIVIVLVSLKARLIPAALLSIVAYLLLDYFFTEPLFHLAMNQSRSAIIAIIRECL